MREASNATIVHAAAIINPIVHTFRSVFQFNLDSESFMSKSLCFPNRPIQQFWKNVQPSKLDDVSRVFADSESVNAAVLLCMIYSFWVCERSSVLLT